MFRFVVILALVAAPALQAADLVAVPADVAVKQQTLMPLVPLTVQPKIVYAARSLAGPIMQGTATEQSADAAVNAAFGANTDIMTLASIVMMQAAKDAEADLKQMMEEIRKLNEQKDAMRRSVAALKEHRAAMSKALAAQYDSRAALPSLAKTPFLQLEYARFPPEQPVDPSTMTVEQLDAKIESLEKTMDSMSEFNEVMALKLQMSMDRMARFYEMLSNVMKKIADTASTIVTNLK